MRLSLRKTDSYSSLTSRTSQFTYQTSLSTQKPTNKTLNFSPQWWRFTWSKLFAKASLKMKKWRRRKLMTYLKYHQFITVLSLIILCFTLLRFLILSGRSLFWKRRCNTTPSTPLSTRSKFGRYTQKLPDLRINIIKQRVYKVIAVLQFSMLKSRLEISKQETKFYRYIIWTHLRGVLSAAVVTRNSLDFWGKELTPLRIQLTPPLFNGKTLDNHSLPKSQDASNHTQSSL